MDAEMFLFGVLALGLSGIVICAVTKNWSGDDRGSGAGFSEQRNERANAFRRDTTTRR